MLHQIVFEVEVHIKQKIGETLEYILKIAIHEKGISNENVEIGDEEATVMVKKFLKEGQSSNGVVLTMNRNTDGLEQYEKGIQLKPF